MHAALGVDRAAERAGAALHAAAGVAGDRRAAGAERGGALHRQLAVAAHPLGVELGHVQDLLGLGEVGLELGAQAMPKRSRQCSSTSSGARKQVPELITVVPPTALATGTGIGGRPSAMVRPAVAVEARRAPRAGRSGSVAVVVAAGLEHDHVEAGLGQRRAATAPPAPEPTITHVALLALPRGSVSPSEPAGSGSEPSASAQRDLVADARWTSRRRPRSQGSRTALPSAAGRGRGGGASAPCGAGSPRRPRGRGG